eukprot:scaffold73526_cov35-Attheya_sp.AAC.2
MAAAIKRSDLIYRRHSPFVPEALSLTPYRHLLITWHVRGCGRGGGVELVPQAASAASSSIVATARRVAIASHQYSINSISSLFKNTLIARLTTSRRGGVEL